MQYEIMCLVFNKKYLLFSVKYYLEQMFWDENIERYELLSITCKICIPIINLDFTCSQWSREKGIFRILCVVPKHLLLHFLCSTEQRSFLDYIRNTLLLWDGSKYSLTKGHSEMVVVQSKHLYFVHCLENSVLNGDVWRNKSRG